MKKIAIIFPFARENGACRVPCEHSQMFVNAGHYVDLIVRDDDAVFPYAGNLINLKVKSRTGILKIVTYLELYFKIRKIKKKNNYDIAISHIPHCDFINVITKNNEKTITTVHINNEKRYSYLSNKLLGFIFSRSDSVVTVSKQLKENLTSRYPTQKDKIISIYNPVNIEKVRDLANAEVDDEAESSDFIINIGRLDKQKGQIYLIKSFSQMLRSHPGFARIKLLIIGSGPMKEELEVIIKEFGLEDNVILLGFKNNPYKYLKKAKLFVLTSLYEGFPLVLLEAMACGTPILSTACETGPYELLHDAQEQLACGILTPDLAVAEDKGSDHIESLVDDLAENIANVLNSPALCNQLVLNATNKVQKFTPEEVMKSWESLFGDSYGK